MSDPLQTLPVEMSTMMDRLLAEMCPGENAPQAETVACQGGDAEVRCAKLFLFLVKRTDEEHEHDCDSWQCAVIAAPGAQEALEVIREEAYHVKVTDIHVELLGPLQNLDIPPGVVCLDFLHA